MSDSIAAWLVRRWVGLYTRGLPPSLRAIRRDEIDDDLLCQREETLLGRQSGSPGVHIFVRLLLGVPADITWRLAQAWRSSGPGQDFERTGSLSTRILGGLAVFAGAAWGASTVVVGSVGWPASTSAAGAVMSIAGRAAVLALASVLIGLPIRLQDQTAGTGALGAMTATFGILFGAFGAYPLMLLLPVGSAVFVWDLARIGLVSRSLAVVHVAGAVGFFGVYLAALLDYRSFFASGANPFVLLAAPYAVTWIGIGAAVLRGVPRTQAPDPGQGT